MDNEPLPREEYVEQVYLFNALRKRLAANERIQTLLAAIKQELLATSKLPLAIDFLLAELNHSGYMSAAMLRMTHYFAPFQAYLIAQAEEERGRMDMLTAMNILESEAKLRRDAASPVALFLYQLEVLCRNRLSYDYGMQAMAGDPVYNQSWKPWLLSARQKLGIVDIADLIYVHSQHHANQYENDPDIESQVILFGEREGRVALANRRKDPLYLFAALQRQLGYPPVPKPKRADPQVELLPRLARSVERLETRVKLLEDEQRQSGIDLKQFYQPPDES